jgi:hypothetical protein
MARKKTVVDTSDQGWQKRVAELMKRGVAFSIVTADPDFLPGANDIANARKWVRGDGPAIAGAGAMIGAGGLMIVLAFVDPEPTTTLMGMVGGGALLVAGGGTYLFTIAVMRRRYRFRLSSSTGGRFEWEAVPAA